MKHRKFHGIFRLGLVTIALLIGIVVVSLSSLILGIGLLLLLIAFFVFIPKLLCRKCPVRENCAHVVTGKISIRLSPYCADSFIFSDLLLLLVLMIPLFVVPQFWLVKELVLIIAFWGLLLIGVIEILLFVCPSCGNTKCPINKGYKTDRTENGLGK
jgi:hypothetical protein